jgi:hypothetical protein
VTRTPAPWAAAAAVVTTWPERVPAKTVPVCVENVAPEVNWVPDVVHIVETSKVGSGTQFA